MNKKAAKAKAPVAKKNKTFGVPLMDTFFSSIGIYLRNIVPLSIAGAVTLGVLGLFVPQMSSLWQEGRTTMALVVNSAAMVIAGVFALPWYFYALDAVEGRKVDYKAPFANPKLFYAQFVAGIWFWAGFTLGLRYLLGIPSLFVLVMYAFHGFLIADGGAVKGLDALGKSVQLTQGKRIALFAIAGLFSVFNLFGASALGNGTEPLMILGALAGLIVTTNITLLVGARIYLTFEENL